MLDETPLKFFDLTQPCPEEITDCLSLREQYTAELEGLKAQGMCSGCVERGLRNKYIAVVMSNIVKR